MTWHVLQHSLSATDFATSVLSGLSSSPKQLSSRWFYDDKGSALFEAIMESEEYYPSRTERSILEEQADGIAEQFRGQAIDVIDLGAGDGSKTTVLLAALLRAEAKVTYVPVDISEGAMRSLHEHITPIFPDLPIEGIVGDNMEALEWRKQNHGENSKLVLFLGSNIGNFNKAGARGFLHLLWSKLGRDDHLFIGFDLKKDIERLLSAYNDSEGVTAAFNLNLLDRINRELGADFDVEKWRHYGTYNVFSGAMESYLVSLEVQTVKIASLRQEFRFGAWEPIHTEYSYKYLPSDIDDLAASTNFEKRADFLDANKWFCDSLWRAR